LENPNNLQNLYLNSNLVSDISGLNGFLNLRLAIIDSNKISTIPLAICESALNISVVKNSHNIGEITLSNNPITEPPLEIVKQGRQAMLDWYAAKRQRLKEIKIILIGDPKAGKTSLLRRLKDDTFNAEEVQTDGINIEDIRFGECDSFKKQTSLHPLTGHFWDFGGQEIMNATHQFFLTNRSVYLLVLDARNDKEIAGQIRQWIKRIKANGGNSPIIVVANKIDINAGFGFSNEYDLQQEFSQIKGFIKLSCSSGDNLRQLKDKLSEDIPQAEMFSTSIDERWIPIKEELQKKTKKYDFLDEDAFVKICQQYKLTKSHEQESAIEFFHDLGLVLHFKELQLAEYYVLDPYWITYGVYQILTSAFAAKCHGEVAMQKLGFIVNEEEDKISVYRSSRFRKITYTTFQLRFLVEILHQFKLCYCMPNYEHFIIPDLLDTTEPITVTEPIRNDKNRIHIIYEYDYLPRSIIPNIIVEANRIITEKWRTGCVFVVDSCKALISSYQNQLLVTVTGEYKKKREVMAVMRNLIDGINRTLSNKPGILVPLYDTDNKLYADYETLLVMEKDKEKKYKLYTPKKQEWEISRLLDGIPGEDEVQSAQLKKLMLEIKDDVNCVKSNILFVGEQLQKTLDNHFDYLLKLPSIDNIRDELLPAVAVLQTEQYTEIANDIVTFTISQLSTFEGRLSKQLVDIHADLKKTTDTQMKLKLSIPILKQLGVDFNTEFNLTSWAKKMHNKYKLEIFKLLMITNKIPL
jgi:small GTP-binding protein